MRWGVRLFLLIGLLFIFSLAISVSAESSQIKVMTYNVRYGCGSNEVCDNSNEISKYLNTVIDQLDPDIFVIQEGNNKNREKDPMKIRQPFISLQNHLLDTYNGDGGKLNGNPYDKQGIFVKNSVGTIEKFEIKSYNDGHNRFYGRAVVKLNDGQEIVVYNTHLFPGPLLPAAQKKNLKQCIDTNKKKASVKENQDQQDFSITEKEAEKLASIVAEETLPVIVMGDMNAEKDHLQPLMSSLNHVEINYNTFPIKPYCAETDDYGYQDWFQKLDHIFYNGFKEVNHLELIDINSENVQKASDHSPVFATLEIDPSNTKKDSCGNQKIAIMGASNDVDLAGRYPSLLRGTCTGSTVVDFAKGSASIQTQKETQLSQALAVNPDVLIINPSGNTCASSNADNAANVAAKGITTVTEILKQAENVPKIILLTISPRKESVGYVNCITKFNAALKLFGAEIAYKDNTKYQVVDIHPTLDSNSDGLCDNCGDLQHWDNQGHTLVAQQILKEVFDYTGSLSTGTSTSAVGSQSGLAPQPGQQSGAIVQIEQGCAIHQRCKDIDSAWNIFGGVLGLRVGQVWVPPRKDWMTFNDAYGAKQITTAPSTQQTTIKPTPDAYGLIECATADSSLTAEQKAFLDTIAYAEATTYFALKDGVSSYNIYIGGGHFDDLSKFPGITIETPYGSSNAAGRYAFMGFTYDGLKEKGSFATGFGPEEQDKAALVLAKQRGIDTSFSNSNWDTVWDNAARIWAAIRYDKKIDFNTESWFQNKVEGNQIKLKKDKLVDSSLCGNGHSFYCQGNGKSHETLNKAYNLCLQYYARGGNEKKQFNVNSGKENVK